MGVLPPAGADHSLDAPTGLVSELAVARNLGDELLEAMAEMAAHARGEGPSLVTHVFCHKCRKKMVRDARPLDLTYKGQSLTVQQPGWYCSCGEGLLTAEDSAVTDAAYVPWRDRVDGAG